MKSELLSSDYCDDRKQTRFVAAAGGAMSTKAAALNGRLSSDSGNGRDRGGMPDSSEDVVAQLARQVNLTAAFHDYVSRGNNKVSPSPPVLTDETGQRERTPAPCETDHIYANFSGNNNNNKNNVSELAKVPGVSEDAAQQTQKLKEMLLTQLDLIQRQREQLSQKDREVNRLKQEKEALKIRLERMEQRVSYLKEQHKKRKSSDMGLESNPDSPNSTSSSNYSRIIGNSSPTVGLSFSEELDSKSLTRSRKRGRFSKEAEKEVAKSEFPIPLRNDFSRWSKSSSSVSSPAKPLEACLNESKRTSLMPQLINSPRRLSSDSKLKDEMLTEKPYYTFLDTYSCIPLPDNTKTYSTIEVPSWRYHPVTSCYQLEGTENIDDDIFLKRHMKLEIDEKRRKRWDIQRLREQRHNEKLRRGRIASREARKNQEAERVSSYFPETKDVQCIELADSVPVVAFGCIIPDIKYSNFSLSWFSVADRLKEEQSRTKKQKDCRTPSRKGT